MASGWRASAITWFLAPVLAPLPGGRCVLPLPQQRSSWLTLRTGRTSRGAGTRGRERPARAFPAGRSCPPPLIEPPARRTHAVRPELDSSGRTLLSFGRVDAASEDRQAGSARASSPEAGVSAAVGPGQPPVSGEACAYDDVRAAWEPEEEWRPSTE